MVSVLNSWTYESLKIAASKYHTRGEFANGDRNAYSAAQAAGIMDDICGHMSAVRRNWSNEDLKKEALRFTSRTTFQKGSEAAYRASLRRGLLDELFPVDKSVKG